MDKIEEKLLRAGYKITNQRALVLACLRARGESITARSLHKKIKCVNLASVYRTLNLLERLHIVNVETINQEKLYCLSDRPHHHIICEQCGRVKKIRCGHFFKNITKFKNIYHQLTLTGICFRCSS